MKKFRELTAVIIISILLSSCYRIVLGSMGVLDKKAKLEKAHNEHKEIVFIPMHHIGKKEFYEDVKRNVDSLRANGFVFYYEGVKVNTVRDSLKNDTLRRKMRYLIGNDVFAMNLKGGYIDTINQTFLNKKLTIIQREDLTNQPVYSKMGIDTAEDRWADIYLVDMVPAFEKQFGNIVLSECDLHTPFIEKYSCTRYSNKEGKKFVLTGYRNNVIAEKIMNDHSNKIAIIYGAKHAEGVLKVLQQRDSTWKSY